MKTDLHHRGQGLIGIIIVLVIVGLLGGGFYVYLSKQIPEIPKITKKSTEELVQKGTSSEEKIKETVGQVSCTRETTKSGVTCGGTFYEDYCENLADGTGYADVHRCSASAGGSCSSLVTVDRIFCQYGCQNSVCLSGPTQEVIPKTEKPVIQKCTDGTLYGQCSTNKPRYCDGGNLTNNCQKCGCPTNVGIIIFKYSDTILPNLLYCRWPTGSRTLAFKECYDVNYGGKGETLNEYPVLDLITDSINKERGFQDNVIYSLYYLPDYLKNEASKYGLDLKINFNLQGVFDLTESLPQIYNYAANLPFFIKQAEKKMSLSSFDKSIIIFLNDQDFQYREENFEFRSAALSDLGVVLLNFRVGSELITNKYLEILSHEMQHLLGANDLYLEPCPRGPYQLCCADPGGIPEPNKIPKYPQAKACSMCQLIGLNAEGLSQVPSLEENVICSKTAEEMGWIK